MWFSELLEQLESDYPELKFRAGKRFYYRAPRLITYEQVYELNANGKCDVAKAGSRCEQNKNGENLPQWQEVVDEQKYGELQLLHEVGHAVLKHRDFRTDVERLKMERAAWEKARALAERYGVEYDEEFVEAEMDTYRDWLYKRSKCPQCGATRYQNTRGEYHCPLCEGLITRDAGLL